MRLTVNLIDANSVWHPVGEDIDESLIPQAIREKYSAAAQPPRRVPDDYQGQRFIREDGTPITDWEEHLAAARELNETSWRRSGLRYYNLDDPATVHEPDSVDGLNFYDERPGQGVAESEATRLARSLAGQESEEQGPRPIKRRPGEAGRQAR